MIYTKLTVRAMQVAYSAHHGQNDTSGAPYIFHPFHVAELMTDEHAVCAALLHDVVEDTDVTLADLEKEFPREVTEAVRLLTHEEGADYRDYILAIKENELARKVKLADLAHNLDRSRIIGICDVPTEKLAHWEKKYTLALKLLKD